MYKLVTPQTNHFFPSVALWSCLHCKAGMFNHHLFKLTWVHPIFKAMTYIHKLFQLFPFLFLLQFKLWPLTHQILVIWSDIHVLLSLSNILWITLNYNSSMQWCQYYNLLEFDFCEGYVGQVVSWLAGGWLSWLAGGWLRWLFSVPLSSLLCNQNMWAVFVLLLVQGAISTSQVVDTLFGSIFICLSFYWFNQKYKIWKNVHCYFQIFLYKH